MQIGFNARYFIDLLAEIETPEVRVELSGELDPAVVRPADGSDYVCVVMPMRLCSSRAAPVRIRELRRKAGGTWSR